jgi:hypothetical protein
MPQVTSPIPGYRVQGRWPESANLFNGALSLLADPDPADFSGSLVREGPQRVIARIGAQGTDYYLKRYQPRGPIRRLKACLRPPAARRAWRCLHQLRREQIATIDPVGTLTARGNLRANRGARPSLLITRAWDGIPLDQFLRGNPPALNRHAVWQNFAALYARLLSRGFYHGDPILDNFLVNPSAKLVLVDVDSIKPWPFLTRRMMVKNLIRLQRSLLVQRRRYDNLGLTCSECRGVTQSIVAQPALKESGLSRELSAIFTKAEND